MSKKYHYYTKEEDKVILSNAKNNVNNLAQSFRISAKQLDRTVISVTSRYYYITKKPDNYCFLTTAEKKAFLNRKVVKEPDKSRKIEKHSILRAFFNAIIKLFQK